MALLCPHCGCELAYISDICPVCLPGGLYPAAAQAHALREAADEAEASFGRLGAAQAKWLRRKADAKAEAVSPARDTAQGLAEQIDYVTANHGSDGWQSVPDLLACALECARDEGRTSALLEAAQLAEDGDYFDRGVKVAAWLRGMAKPERDAR